MKKILLILLGCLAMSIQVAPTYACTDDCMPSVLDQAMEDHRVSGQ